MRLFRASVIYIIYIFIEILKKIVANYSKVWYNKIYYVIIEGVIAVAVRKKTLTYNGKAVMRCGNRIFYGNLEDRFIVVLDILETNEVNNLSVASKVVVQLMDNTGERGKGEVFRKVTRGDLYKALEVSDKWINKD